MLLLLVDVLLACSLAYRQRTELPIAYALTVMFVANGLRHYGSLQLRADALLWLLWPLPTTVLAWWVWRGHRALLALSAAFVACAACISLARVAWTPELWWVAVRAPHLAGATLGITAWLTRRSYKHSATTTNVVKLLVLSGALDITIGALSPGSGWSTRLTWLTWITVGVALVHGILAACARRARENA